MLSYRVIYILIYIIYRIIPCSTRGVCDAGMKQMFSQGMADVLLDACSDFWDGHDIRPLGTEERFFTLWHYDVQQSQAGWHPGTLTLSPEHQSVQMSKITNDGLTRSGTGCFIVVPIWQQWASKG